MRRATWLLSFLTAWVAFAAFAAPEAAVYEVRRMIPTLPGNFVEETPDAGAAAFRGGMGEPGWGFACIGARMLVPPSLTVSVGRTGEFGILDANSVAGLVVDYGTPSGYLTRVLYALGPCSEERVDTIPPWGKASKPDKVRPAEVPADGRLRLDLAPDAPIGWDGRIWLSLLMENTGPGTELKLGVPGAVRVQAEADPCAPPLPLAPIAWKTVALPGRAWFAGDLDPVEDLALQKLKERAGQTEVGRLAEAPLPAKDRPSLIIGRVADLRECLGAVAEDLEGQLADEAPWRAAQGYAIRYLPDTDTLIATARDRLGLVYALAHLERSLIDAPEPGIGLERFDVVEKPKTEERGVYLNIGYGLSVAPLSPDTWDEVGWERFIDQLVLSRATFWSFYLWTEIEHVYPGHTPDYAEKNARVHRNLKHAIDYGHRRGLRAVFLFTPTNIPADMLVEHPEWKTTLEYTNNGGICSRVPAAYEAALKVHRHQMEYFQDCDEVEIAFYDCGGCMCEECRKGDVQRGELLKQVRDFSALTWEINPKARFGFWTWAVWRYERKHSYSMRDRLIPEIAEIVKGNEDRVLLIDSYHGDAGSEPYFKEAKKNGFRTSNFVYQTNIEDGWIFALPLMGFQRKWAGMTQENGLDESFLMLMEAGSKYPTAHFGTEYFWDAGLTDSQVAGRYALQLTGNARAADDLQQAFLRLERLTFDGALGVDDAPGEAKAMREAFEKAAANASERQRPALGWLMTTARAYETLYLAVDARDRGDRAAYAKLKDRYLAILAGDPLFATFAADHGARTFDQFVGWVGNGFRNGYF